MFAIPFERDFTLIGTTDVEYHGDPRRVDISAEEIAYLCGISNDYFRTQITPSDVRWTFAGVRPLLDDGAGNAQAVTRDYELVTQSAPAPLLSVFGGKITTYRKLAEEAVDRLGGMIDIAGPAWTQHASLPGGDIFGGPPSTRTALGFRKFQVQLAQRYPWLPSLLLERYAQSYGTRIHRLLADCHAMADLGEELLPSLHENEVHYMMRTEWATCAADVLWRRSKLGLHASSCAVRKLEAWMMRAGKQMEARCA